MPSDSSEPGGIQMAFARYSIIGVTMLCSCCEAHIGRVQAHACCHYLCVFCKNKPSGEEMTIGTYANGRFIVVLARNVLPIGAVQLH